MIARTQILRGLVVLLTTLGCSEDKVLQTAIFVDQSAPADGDGSKEAPVQTMREALSIVDGVSAIVVAAGRYEVPSDTRFEGALTIVGSLGEPTIFVAENEKTRIRWQTPVDEVLVIRDLHFESATEFYGGQVELNSVSVTGEGPSLVVRDGKASFYSVDAHFSAQTSGDFGGDAVLVQRSELLWKDGGSVDAFDRALVVQASIATLEGLELRADTRAALYAEEASEVTANSLRIEDSGWGIFVRASTLVLSDSTLTRISKPAVFVSAGASVTLRDSKFLDCIDGFVAASIGAVSVTVERNEFVGSRADACITIGAGTLMAHDNLVDDCRGMGISVIGGSEVDIQRNTVQNIKLDSILQVASTAISVHSTVGVISDNIVRDTLDVGITVTKSVVQVDGNVIGPTGSSGISYVEGPAEASTFSNNTIRNAVGAGILVFDASVAITGNDIGDTLYNTDTSFGDGVVFGLGAQVNVSGNTIVGSARNGIVFLNGGMGEISGNILTDNQYYGVYEFCTGEANVVTVGSNTLSGNLLGEQRFCSP